MRFNTEGLFIKVSGVTSEEDALFSIGLGASAVGFEFGPTPRTDLVRASRTTSCAVCPTARCRSGVFERDAPAHRRDRQHARTFRGADRGRDDADRRLAYVAERVNTVIRALAGADELRRSHVVEGVDYFLLPESDEHESLIDCLEAFQDVASHAADRVGWAQVVQRRRRRPELPGLGRGRASGVERVRA